MKKIKFIVTAACMLTSLCIQAVDVIEPNTDYYILNVETNLFLGGQNIWGTQASISEDAGVFRFVTGTLNGGAGGYNIVNTIVRMNDKNLGTNLYTDNSGTMNVIDNYDNGTVKNVDGIWEIVPINPAESKYAFRCLSSWGYSTTTGWTETKYGYLAGSTTPGVKKGYVMQFQEELSSAAHFYVFTRQEAIDYITSVARTNNVSYSFLLTNPDFCRGQYNTAWTVTGASAYALGATPKVNSGGNMNDNVHDQNGETYCTVFTVYQTIQGLPAGRYQLSCQGFWRQDQHKADAYGDGMPAAYVKFGGTTVTTPMSELTGSENSMTEASTAFAAGKYQSASVNFVLEEASDVEIGFRADKPYYWCIFDNIQLKNYSNAKEYAQELLDAVEYLVQDLGNVIIKENYENAYSTFKNFVNSIIDGDGTTIDDINIRYATFQEAETAWKESVAAWRRYLVVAERAKKMHAQITSQIGQYEDNTSLNALTNYVSAEASDYGQGSNVGSYTFVNGCYNYIINTCVMNDGDIPTEIAFLESLMNDVKAQTKVKDGTDVTYLLANPDFTDSEGRGWNGISGITAVYGGLTGWPCAEAYDKSAFDLYQIVEKAPAGLYSISVNAFYRPSTNGNWNGSENVPVEIYMGSMSSPIQHIAMDALENDLVQDEYAPGGWADGNIAKNGTNCYYWDNQYALTDADRELWKNNYNVDESIRIAMINSSSMTVAGKYNSDYVWDGKLVPNGMDGASIAFSAGRYPMTVYGNVEDEGDGTGTLRIGIRSTSAMHWALWSNFKLTLLGVREEIKNKVRARLETLVSAGLSGLNPDVDIDELFSDTTESYCAIVSAMLENGSTTYNEYAEAYDSLGVLIDNYNSYKSLISGFHTSQNTLSGLISNYDDKEDEVRIARKTFASNVYNAYQGLLDNRRLMRSQEDVAKDIQYVKDVFGATIAGLTEETLPQAAVDAENYVSTYAMYEALQGQAVAQLNIAELSPRLTDFAIGVSDGEEYLFDGTSRQAGVTGPGAYEWQVVYVNETSGEESTTGATSPGSWHVKIKALRSGSYHSAVFDNVVSFTIYKANESDMAALRLGYEASSASGAWTTPWVFSDADDCAASLAGVTFTRGRITAISLPENNISYVPEQWAGLTALQTLNLDGNHIENVAVLPEGMDASGFSCKNQTVITPLSFNVSRMTAESIAASMPMSFLYDHGTQGLVNSISATLSGEPLNMVMYFTNTGGSWDLGYSTDQKVYRGQNGQHLTLTLQSGEAKGSTMDVTLSFDKGDANFTSGVDITDLQATVNFALDNYSSLFNFTAANLVEDDVINVQDIVCLVDILLSQNANARHIIQHRVAAVSEEDTDAHLYWDSGQLILETSEPVAAIDISMAGDADFTLLRQAGFTVASRGHRTIAYSMSGALLGVGATVIATADSESDVDDAVMANRNAARVSVDFNIDNVTGVSDIKNLSEDNNAHDFFDLNGRKLGKNADSPRGVYIIRDKATGKAEKRVNK